MSHELRTPLNAILGFAQLLQRDIKQPLPDRHRTRVAHILKGGDHLLRLVEDLLDLSRIEAGHASTLIEPVDVLDVIAQVRSQLGPTAASAQLQLHLDTPEGAELPKIAADQTRFAQILLNFGSNAIKYNRPCGSVTFRVTVSQPGCVRVSVYDTGIGIPDDKQCTLFQPFQRAGQERGTIAGTGMGLVIARRLANLMRGSVGFSSVWSEGSEFWVDMPVHA